MTNDFETKRLLSMGILLCGESGVIIDHDYQEGKLISIFSKRSKEDSEAIIKICRKTTGDYSIRETLEYSDSDNSYFDGFRLKSDMETLGFDHLFTFRPGWDSMHIQEISAVSEYMAAKECEVAGKLYISNTYSSEVAKAYFEEILKQLVDNAKFCRLEEKELYKVLDSAGNVPTDHPRVCQVAQGTFVSHPLCKKCGKHSGMCSQYQFYLDAVDWAERKDVRCFDCLPKKEKARIEKARDEECDELDCYDGCSCSCPLEGGQ